MSWMTKDFGFGIGFVDNMGFIITKEEWEKVKDSVIYFYENVDAESIKKHNEINMEKYYPEYARTNRLGLKKEQKGNQKQKRKTKKKPKKGFVYFIKADNGLTKIGFAKDFKKRLDHFTTKLPYELKLVHTIETDDMEKTERYFHELFKGKRKRGEWFDLNEEQLDFVINFKKGINEHE